METSHQSGGARKMSEAWVSCPNCDTAFPVGIIDADGLLKIPYQGKLYAPGSDFNCPHCHYEFPIERTEFKTRDPTDHSLVRRGIFKPESEVSA